MDGRVIATAWAGTWRVLRPSWLLAAALWLAGLATAHAQVAQPSIPTNPTALSTSELWAVVVGIFVPLVAALPMQPGWPQWGRAVVGVLVCLVAGFVTAYLDGALTYAGADGVVRAIGMVLLASWSSYASFWAKVPITSTIEHKVFNLTGPRVERQSV